ncbi:MAG: hypothetical protein IT436_13240 [Phycisphaerales bacterium]|nr:hypothetical protein [Phycisphaerales bacterium]
MRWMPLTLSTVAACLVAAAASARQPHMQVPGGAADAGTRDLRKLCDPRWADGKFLLPGVDDQVRVTTVWDPDGAGPALPVLVAGGYFTTAGGVTANRIAAWDGTRWSPLGTGMDTLVNALTTYDPDGAGPTSPVLVAGGWFTSAGGMAAGYIAAWDGTRWSPLGNGMNNEVYALTTCDRDGPGPAPPILVAGGRFTTAGDVTANSIAAWDGSGWSALGAGMNNEVKALTMYDSDGAGPSPPILVAGGRFTTAGAVGANFIAAWDGTRWSPLGTGMNNRASALTSYDPDEAGPAPPVLVAGGDFTTAGGVGANFIAAWDGTRWSPLSAGMDNYVRALTKYDPDGAGPESPVLVAGGYFTTAGGVVANCIAAWDGTRWSALDTGMNSFVISLAVLALTTYDPDGAGPESPVLVAGGWFTSAGGVATNFIAAWDGTRWSALGTGMNGPALALTTYDRDRAGPAPPILVAGGAFTAAGDVGASRIAAWDGARWSPLGTGMKDYVFAVTTYDPDGAGPAPPVLVAAGNAAGDLAAIASWDGTCWSSLGKGMNDPVLALTMYDPDGAGPTPPVLVAGGLFTTAGGVAANFIAAWDGTRWSPLGTGMNKQVNALTTYDPDGTGPASPVLVAGGWFTSGGGVAAYVAAWDGTRWSPLGTGVNNEVFALTTYDPDGTGPTPPVLVAGGYFTAAGGVAANGIAAWDGTRWSPLGMGMSDSVLALTTYDLDGAGPAPPVLVAGGLFALAGGVAARNIAAWDGTHWSPLGVGMSPSVYALTTYDPDGAGPALDSLFAGGDFLRAGGGVSAYIAEWYRPLSCPPGLQLPWPNQINASCPADFDYNGVVDVLDLIEFVNRFDAGDPSADVNGDGRLDNFDFLEMSNAINAGGP